MVFPQDLKWRHDYLTANGMFRDDKQSMGNSRYRTWGTEELLVRCIRKNLPWVRTIHILLARESQVEYLNDWSNLNNQSDRSSLNDRSDRSNRSVPKIHFVFHKDFIPADKLPTFNSRTIEMYLHRIPWLAPYFLYGNDDMFPLAPMEREDFFRETAADATGTGALLPCLHWTIKSFNPEKAFHKACMNGMNFVASEFGKHYNSGWIHVGHNVVPMVKATCEMFWERWPEKMDASVTTFRQVVNFNQYIYSWWQISSEQYVNHKPPRGYISTDNSEEEIVKAIRTAEGLLCINDNDSVDDITNLAAVVRSEIQKRL